MIICRLFQPYRPTLIELQAQTSSPTMLERINRMFAYIASAPIYLAGVGRNAPTALKIISASVASLGVVIGIVTLLRIRKRK